MTTSIVRDRGRERDEGAVLPLVLVVAVVLGTVVAAIATYGIASLRYSQVTELAADHSGIYVGDRRA